jgi:hypothetical protein
MYTPRYPSDDTALLAQPPALAAARLAGPIGAPRQPCRLGPGTLDHADHLSGHTLLIAEGACSSRRGEVDLDFWKLQRHAESMLRHCPHPKAISEFSRTIAARSPRSLSAHLGLRSKRAARHWSQG